MIENDTRNILSRYDTFAKKMYGQNFITNKSILENIVKYSEIDKEMGVIEIGPGIGALTEMLALSSKKVLCYEIDPNMIKILNETITKYENVIIKNIDILKADIDKDIQNCLSDTKEVRAVANLPYYITTPILFKFLEESHIKHYLFMVQKEVGQRLTGRPNTKDYNALSVLMAYKTKSEIVGNVSRKFFYPEPNVDSVLLRVEVVKNDYNINNEANFLKYIQVIFAQRRKTFVNNINNYYSIKKEDLITILINLGYNYDIRAEALNIDDIVKIYKAIFEC